MAKGKEQKAAPEDSKLISVQLHEAIMSRVRNGLRSGASSGVACPECGLELILDQNGYQPPPARLKYDCPAGHTINLTHYKES